MNKALRSILSLLVPAMAFALTMPILSAAPAPSGRVSIMNAHSNLCLSPAGGNREKNDEMSNSRVIRIRLVFGALPSCRATLSRSRTRTAASA